ncbi:MAG: NFACT RNA binding domain-containing protein [Balneolales bacterium]|nr:NFACT RNA binding domain-containing protein [Balneolales bacterium]
MLDLFFESPNKSEIKLSFSAVSVKTALFSDPRTSVRKSNTTSFFDSLRGEKVLHIDIANSDRILTLHFETKSIVFAIYGSRPNAFLCDDTKILDSFKNPSVWIGQNRPESRKPIAESLFNVNGRLKKKIQRAFPLFPREFIDDVILNYALDSDNLEKTERVFTTVIDQLKTKPSPRILSDGRFTIISSDFLPDNQAEGFQNCNDAIRVAFFTEIKENRFSKQKLELLNRTDKFIKRYEELVNAGDYAWKSLERAEKYEQYGNLLMTRAHEQIKGEESITLENFYDENNPVTIGLNPLEDLATNAQSYFDKKKKSESSYDYAIKISEESKPKLEELHRIRSLIHEAADLDQLNKIAEGFRENELFASNQKTTENQQKPYKIGSLGKYEIWIGKNAKSNDALLRDANKDDIWFHIRDTTGSHLLLRMNKEAAEPDIKLLETVAGWAAWLSKSKGSQLSPVVYVRRKFVRKPKDAPAGTAIYEKEKVLLVSPKKPPF